jgi:hypothetical protein
VTGLEAGRVAAPGFLRPDVAARDEAGKAVGAFRWAALLVVVATVTAVAVWVVSPRFAIDSPSLIDDWSAISASGDQLRTIAHLDSPEQQRFRPGWIAWNYVQWHTFDAPEGLVGPNAWNVLRLLVLVAGLSLLALLAMPAARTRREALLQAALAGTPALLLVTAPKLAFDFARFGPQEPLLVGGMALGGSLLVLAAQQLLDGTRPVRRAVVTALLIAGSLLWIVGAYQKEVSLAALPLLAAVVIAGRGRLRSWNGLARARTRLLVLVGVVFVAPLAHVAVESARITLRGDLVYDAKVDRGRGLAQGVEVLYGWARDTLPRQWELLVVLALVLTVAAALIRRKVDVVAVGVLGSAGLAFVLAGQSGVVATRYLIPVLALLVLVLPLALARFTPVVQLAGLLAVLVTLMPLPEAHTNVAGWADGEIARGRIVREVAAARASGCVVAAAGLDEEEARALPVLMDLRPNTATDRCADGRVLLVAGPLAGGEALVRACDPATLEPVIDGIGAMLYRCGRLRESASARELVERRQL